MKQIQGRFNTAVSFAATLDARAEEQIRAVCDVPQFAGCKIRIMPDVHAGKGCTIGTTMTLTDKVVPAMVGVDIGCGMLTVKLSAREIDFAALDELIRREVPSGESVRQTPHPLAEQAELESLRCADSVNPDRAYRSVGTLGGGNHFIEIDKGGDGALYLVIHSGSRNVGAQTAEYYQSQGEYEAIGCSSRQIAELITEYKAAGRQSELQTAIEEALAKRKNAPRTDAYITGGLFADYIHDMKLMQRYAALNRQAMAQTILDGMGICAEDSFTTMHNYIDAGEMILRKGAVSAKKGERLLIPINMRDGSLLCVGKGNEDWNCSAPHGAGRLLGRRQARQTLTMEAYREAMRGIYTTAISRSTLDESPMAYKSLEDIVSNIEPTVEIVERITPVYNFKA